MSRCGKRSMRAQNQAASAYAAFGWPMLLTKGRAVSGMKTRWAMTVCEVEVSLAATLFLLRQC